MSQAIHSQSATRARDWSLRISLAVTVVWLVLGFLYISNVVGWTDFVHQRAPALGGFLEGAFAPLAFLWLVVGFFLQQQQLEANTRTIERQLEVMQQAAQQAEIQSRAIAADELHSRQDTFLRIADMVGRQLGGLSGLLHISWAMEQGAEVREDAVAQLRAQGAGDLSAPDRAMFGLFYSGRVTPAQVFWGSPVRTQHSENFTRSFERLVRLAGACDPEGVIADAIRDGTSGRIYRFMRESRPAA